MKELKILMIDDDEEDYLILRDTLSGLPGRRYVVDWAPDFQQAIDQIHLNEHDLYLVDYRLGTSNGLDLIRLAIREGCECPIILMTGQGDDQIDEQALDAGAAD